MVIDELLLCVDHCLLSLYLPIICWQIIDWSWSFQNCSELALSLDADGQSIVNVSSVFNQTRFDFFRRGDSLTEHGRDERVFWPSSRCRLMRCRRSWTRSKAGSRSIWTEASGPAVMCWSRWPWEPSVFSLAAPQCGASPTRYKPLFFKVQSFPSSREPLRTFENLGRVPDVSVCLPGLTGWGRSERSSSNLKRWVPSVHGSVRWDIRWQQKSVDQPSLPSCLNNNVSLLQSGCRNVAEINRNLIQFSKLWQASRGRRCGEQPLDWTDWWRGSSGLTTCVSARRIRGPREPMKWLKIFVQIFSSITSKHFYCHSQKVTEMLLNKKFDTISRFQHILIFALGLIFSIGLPERDYWLIVVEKKAKLLCVFKQTRYKF